MQRLRARVTYANVMATVAVFLALGGASYAAVNLPKNSVGTKQLQKNAVKVGKIGPEAVKVGKIAKNTITTNRLRDKVVSTGKLGEAAVSNSKIGADAVTGDKVKDGSLLAGDFAPGQLPAVPTGLPGGVEYVFGNAAGRCEEDPEFEACFSGPAGYHRIAAVAKCPAGSSPVGGGFHLLGVTGNDNPGEFFGKPVASEPYADGGASKPNAWRVLYDTNSYTFEEIRAWVACVKDA